MAPVKRAVTVRRMAGGACADVGPGVTTRHRGGRPSLVEENQPAAEALLRAPPRFPALSDVGTILFAGVHGFFEADPLGGEEARQHRLVSFHAVRTKQALSNRIKRQIVLLAPQFQEPIPVRLSTERRSPPVGKAAVRRVSSNAFTQRIALAIPTRKIRAASFRDFLEPPFRRAVPTTPADQAGAHVDCFPAYAAFRNWPEGRHPHCHFRGLLRLSR